MAEALWNWEALVAAAGGGAEDAPSQPVTGFSIDTRTLVAGEVFVALRDQRDGHEFVTAAFAKGAAAALVERGYRRKAGDGALIRVEDTLRGLERIGIAARARLAAAARVIAVTGSAGKTGTKEMLRAALGRVGRVHAPDKSFNNHWGVPLTLARMPADTEYGVFEIGMNHAGEIRPLTRMVRSHVAIITNVLPVHVGNFADGEIGIANAKAEIFEGVEPGGVAILPGDSLHALLLTGNARRAGARVVTFGRGEGADVRAVEIAADGDRSRIVADAQGAKIAYRLGAPGAHLAENSLAVAAALHVLAIAPDRALGALAQIAAGPGRGQRITFRAGAGRVLLIDESYNANPASMAAAIRTAAGARQGGHKRLVVALGDMLELGADAGRHHTDLAPVLDAAGADVIFGCGPNMKLLFDALPTAKRGAWAETSAGLVDVVPQALQAGDVVMVKGSLGSRMAPIVDAIKKRFAAEGGSV